MLLKVSALGFVVLTARFCWLCWFCSWLCILAADNNDVVHPELQVQYERTGATGDSGSITWGSALYILEFRFRADMEFL